MAMIVSLYFSQVMNLQPCVLCWYQRILMYPLVIVLLVGLWKNDKHIHWHVLPFSVLGMVISLYQYLLQYSIIHSGTITQCTSTVPCEAKQYELLGFITIPLMAFAAFTLITLCMILHHHKTKAEL